MADRLDPKVVDALLDRLSSDDDFRERFQADPAAALAEVGAGDFEAASCLSVTRLASKEALRAARGALTAQLGSAMSQQPHKLEG
ncbi:MAG TPA: NHLP-related RiPP peptide [Xanthomonadaceae bacterium]|nr:NHLP-related RiPP peptide [Xanthomonadaceae bacterium]